MKKLDKILDNVMRFLMAVAMFALLAGGTWQIFTRWILRNPSTVTDEFLRYVLIWASMIGSAYCFYKDKHLALDLVKGRAKGAFNVVLSVFIEAAVLCGLRLCLRRLEADCKRHQRFLGHAHPLQVPVFHPADLRRVHHSGSRAEVCTALRGA